MSSLDKTDSLDSYWLFGSTVKDEDMVWVQVSDKSKSNIIYLSYNLSSSHVVLYDV